MQVISRNEAKALGLKHYFTGEPCKHGHVSSRFVSIGNCCERERKYREENKEAIAEYARKYSEENKEAIAERMRKYREENPLQSFTRNSIQRIEKAVGDERIERAEVELGYTQEEFKEHIESLFEDGMSWENRSEWHIDHIVPVSWWLSEGITEVSMINALINLQPLWASDNLSKSNKI